jgi:hypothetical protein
LLFRRAREFDLVTLLQGEIDRRGADIEPQGLLDGFPPIVTFGEWCLSPAPISVHAPEYVRRFIA